MHTFNLRKAKTRLGTTGIILFSYICQLCPWMCPIPAGVAKTMSLPAPQFISEGIGVVIVPGQLYLYNTIDTT